MFHAEDQQLLNEGLYGSRPGRSAHEPVLIEILQNEIYRSSMKAGIHKDLDATSCYDRILSWVANLCSRRVGVHHKVAIVNCRTLEKARYHLKTNIEVSAEFYQHCDAFPIYKDQVIHHTFGALFHPPYLMLTRKRRTEPHFIHTMGNKQSSFL